jgi:hypothetical protein
MYCIVGNNIGELKYISKHLSKKNFSSTYDQEFVVIFLFAVLNLKESPPRMSSSSPDDHLDLVPDCTISCEDQDFYLLVKLHMTCSLCQLNFQTFMIFIYCTTPGLINFKCFAFYYSLERNTFLTQLASLQAFVRSKLFG